MKQARLTSSCKCAARKRAPASSDHLLQIETSASPASAAAPWNAGYRRFRPLRSIRHSGRIAHPGVHSVSNIRSLRLLAAQENALLNRPPRACEIARGDSISYPALLGYFHSKAIRSGSASLSALATLPNLHRHSLHRLRLAHAVIFSQLTPGMRIAVTSAHRQRQPRRSEQALRPIGARPGPTLSRYRFQCGDLGDREAF